MTSYRSAAPSDSQAIARKRLITLGSFTPLRLPGYDAQEVLANGRESSWTSEGVDRVWNIIRVAGLGPALPLWCRSQTTVPRKRKRKAAKQDEGKVATDRPRSTSISESAIVVPAERQKKRMRVGKKDLDLGIRPGPLQSDADQSTALEPRQYTQAQGKSHDQNPPTARSSSRTVQVPFPNRYISRKDLVNENRNSRLSGDSGRTVPPAIEVPINSTILDTIVVDGTLEPDHTLPSERPRQPRRNRPLPVELSNLGRTDFKSAILERVMDPAYGGDIGLGSEAGWTSEMRNKRGIYRRVIRGGGGGGGGNGEGGSSRKGGMTTGTLGEKGTGRVRMIQEQICEDTGHLQTWKLLVLALLLDRGADASTVKPTYDALVAQWADPEALASAKRSLLRRVLAPVGQTGRRASFLQDMSQQYADSAFFCSASTRSAIPPKQQVMSPPKINPATGMPRPTWAAYQAGDASSSAGATPSPLTPTFSISKTPNGGLNADSIRDFAGSTRYAMDSFLIFSTLLPGVGAPSRVGEWLGTEHLAGKRWSALADRVLSWAEDEEDLWRLARPTDAVLIEYLVWRWGIEGVVYLPKGGPQLDESADKFRLGQSTTSASPLAEQDWEDEKTDEVPLEDHDMDNTLTVIKQEEVDELAHEG